MANNIWESNYITLLDHCHEHGNYFHSLKEKNPAIFKWLGEQFIIFQNANLPASREKALRDLGFNPSLPFDVEEAEFHELLEKFCAENGHRNVPIDHPNENFVTWFMLRQMGEKAILFKGSTEASKKSMREFKPNKRNARWEQRFAELKDFKNKFGHLEIPNDSTYGSLRNWRQRQVDRKNTNKLPEHQEKRLSSLGMFQWDADTRWESQYRSLVAFYEEHKHFKVPKDGRYSSLWHWLKFQKGLNSKGALEKNRKELLVTLRVLK